MGQFFNRYINYRKENDHSTFGFERLHHECIENCGSFKIFIQNKQGNEGKVRVRTVNGGAKAGDDYEALD